MEVEWCWFPSQQLFSLLLGTSWNFAFSVLSVVVGFLLVWLVALGLGFEVFFDWLFGIFLKELCLVDLLQCCCQEMEIS